MPAVALLALAPQLASAPEGPPPPARAAAYARLHAGELPAELPVALAGGFVLVEGVRVNGEGPFRFLLDTGAMGAGRVDASLAQRLRLETTGEPSGTRRTTR